jgi:hypothetical protein
MLRQSARTLFPSATFPPRAELQATYRTHADGGLTPITAGSRGALTARCPHDACNAILVREASAAALSHGYFQCPACHRKSLGAAARASMRRREAGTLRATENGGRVRPGVA